MNITTSKIKKFNCPKLLHHTIIIEYIVLRLVCCNPALQLCRDTRESLEIPLSREYNNVRRDEE